MQTGLVLGLAVLFVGVFAEEISKEQVKRAFIDGLKQVHEDPKYIEGYEKNWDGSLPETIEDLKTLLRNIGVPEQDVQKTADGMCAVVKNKDNPSWKTIYGDLFVAIGHSDRSIIEALEQNAGDHVPRDIEEAKEILKKVGVQEEHLLGHAKILVWLAQLKA